MNEFIEGILKDWGDRLYQAPLRGAKGKNVRGGGKTKKARPAAKPNGPATREKISRTVKKTPEVMVKISGGGKNMPKIKAHFDYISRNGEVELEDETGEIHLGRESLKELRDAWAKGRIGIPNEGEKRKEAFNIILSMPPGTDRKAVKNAARAFGKDIFSEHQYLFASHEDEKHPHVHLCVKAVDQKGIRMNPRKGDLQHWREVFAEKLRDHGIEANATPRRARGIVQKAERQNIRQIDRGFSKGLRNVPSKTTLSTLEDVKKALDEKYDLKNPHRAKIEKSRREVQRAYGEIAKTLSKGTTEDKVLALEITKLVKAMPGLSSKQEMMVENGTRKRVDSVQKGVLTDIKIIQENKEDKDRI